jgi:hypothetical protein
MSILSRSKFNNIQMGKFSALAQHDSHVQLYYFYRRTGLMVLQNALKLCITGN